MKREWKKRRVLKEQADGQRRWDQALAARHRACITWCTAPRLKCARNLVRMMNANRVSVLGCWRPRAISLPVTAPTRAIVTAS